MKDIIFPITYKSDPKGLTDAEKDLQALQKTVFKMGQAAIASFAVATAAIAVFSVESVKAAAEAEAVGRGLENAAKNAGVFGDSAASINKATAALDKHSTQLAELTGIDDEIINQIKTGWLAVPALAAMGVEGLNKLATVVADTAAGTGKDVTAIGLAFQKVAGDTENAFSKLSRAGIVFTQEQKDTFDSLLETNGEMAAQQYLIEQLGQKYAGAAEATANPFARLDVIFENLQETLGVQLLPVIEKVVDKFTEFIETKGPQIEEAFTVVADSTMSFFDALFAVGDFFDKHPGLFEAVAIALTSVATALGLATAAMWAFNIAAYANPIVLVVGLIVVAIGAVIAAIVMLAMNWETVTTNMKNNWDILAYAVGSVWTGMINGIIDGINTVLNLINGVLGSKLQVARVEFNGLGAGKKDKQGRSLAPGQATGGETTRAGLSWVGERGPELLNLPTGAQVIPLSKIGNGGGGGATVNISVNAGMGADGAAIGEQIVTAIRKYERTSGAVFAKA